MYVRWLKLDWKSLVAKSTMLNISKIVRVSHSPGDHISIKTTNGKNLTLTRWDVSPDAVDREYERIVQVISKKE